MQMLQNLWIIKQTVVLLWKFSRKYGSVSYLFRCIQVPVPIHVSKKGLKKSAAWPVAKGLAHGLQRQF